MLSGLDCVITPPPVPSALTSAITSIHPSSRCITTIRFPSQAPIPTLDKPTTSISSLVWGRPFDDNHAPHPRPQLDQVPLPVCPILARFLSPTQERERTKPG